MYTSIITMYNGNYTISISDQQQCIYNIYTSQYNITVYNIETDGTIRIDQPATFEFNDIFITGIPYTGTYSVVVVNQTVVVTLLPTVETTTTQGI